MQKWPILILITALVFSCGKSTTEEIQDAVLSANIDLSKGDCQSAISGLESLGRQNNNSQYLKTLASAYACRAGYSTTSFFTNDISKTSSPSPLGGMTLYTTSQLTFQSPLEDDPKFIDLQTAINILLYAGGIASTTEPTFAERAKYFTTAEVSDINTELLYFQMAELGIFLKVYGNVNATTGVKGGGSSGNACFSNYPNVPNDILGPPIVYAVKSSLAALPGTCKVTTDVGHPELRTANSTATVRKRRLCQGVVLLNGFIASLSNLAGSLSGSTGATATAANALVVVSQAALTLAYPSIGGVKSTINQTLCEDTQFVPLAEIESYYALMFEGLVK